MSANSPGPPEQERVEGSVAGQRFSIQTTNLVQVLLIVVLGVAGYFQWMTMSRLTEELHADHAHLQEQMRAVGSALRIVDWNQGRPPAERVPIFLPPELFSEHMKQRHPELQPK
jgi:hypothetical protein